MEELERHQNNGREEHIPLQSFSSEDRWINIFKRFDYDHDGRISIPSFIDELKSANDKNIPIRIIQKALKEADQNDDNIITLDEFLTLVKKTEQGKSKYGHVFTAYVRKTVPPRPIRRKQIHPYTETDGEYEDEYKFWPPPIAMILVSLIEVATFLYDVITTGYGSLYGPAASLLIYDPHRRREAWRFLTYMFVHAGATHLIGNLAVQIMLGIPLEMVHGWWRILIIYVAGVTAGSLGTSICDPYVFLAGASGGVYSLLAAHIATLIMNWSEMQFAKIQLVAFLIFGVCDTGTAIYYRYEMEANQQIGFAAHLAGAIAGLLVGINVLRNLEIRSWENKVWWAALIIYILLIGTAITINIALPSYFSRQSL